MENSALCDTHCHKQCMMMIIIMFSFDSPLYLWPCNLAIFLCVGADWCWCETQCHVYAFHYASETKRRWCTGCQVQDAWGQTPHNIVLQAAHKHVDLPKRWHVVSCLLGKGFLAWYGSTLKVWAVENDIYTLSTAAGFILKARDNMRWHQAN